MTAPSEQQLPHGARELTRELLHDLRTPLNLIIGYADMLAEQAEEEGQAAFAPDLHKIHTAGRQLLALINGEVAPQFPAVPDVTTNGSRTEFSNEFGGGTDVGDGSATASVQSRILVVDDIEMNRDVLSRRLERQGHSIAIAENGRIAMDIMRQSPFDLVLLDIMMPELDGYGVLQQIKADEALRNIPVIMISALHEMDSVVRCIELGAEDYLCKPFDPVLLKARIDACIEKKRARDNEVRLHAQLQQSFVLLQESEKQRDDLTNMVVHDLRTPLTSVMAGMQTLEMVGELDDVQKEMVAIALRGGETLLGMINDLLDVDKMRDGSMQLDYTMLDAGELIASAALQVAAIAERESLRFITSTAPGLAPFRGDQNKLRRTLVNLLGNAIKFTPEGGTVTADARLADNGNDMVFSVIDTGEGVAAEEFEHIFDKFGQVASRKAGRTMSTGLGLTFCKLAVEAHGGHISIESEPGQGSTFSFSVPIITSI